MLPGSGTLVVVMVRVPELNPGKVEKTCNAPSELQPFSTGNSGGNGVNMVDVETKLNIASFPHRQSPP